MVELNLTKRQQEIFDYIRRYGAEHGYPPTVRDIGKAIGLTSSSTVHAHLANLEKVGLLRRDPTKPRALEILVDKAKQVVAPSGLPLVGQVAAGEPMLAEENIEEYVPVPGIAGGDEGEFILRVKGDSMKNVGILEGDHVVVRRAGHRRGRGDRRGPGRRRGHGQALLQGGATTCGCSRRTRRSSPSSSATSRSWVGSWVSAGGSHDARRCWIARARRAARERCVGGPRPRDDAGAAPRRRRCAAAQAGAAADCPVCRGPMTSAAGPPRNAATAARS